MKRTRPAGSGSTITPVRTPGAAWAQLTLATLFFFIGFWAWSLIGPLGPSYATDLGLSPGALSLLVAVPVLVGSLGRIPVGALTDKLGGRLVFAIVLFATIAPVLFVGAVNSYPLLLIGGLFLGIGGTVFATGVPFVNGWFPPQSRGTAVGVFGAGMAGTAFSAFFTPRMVNEFGRFQTHLIVAIALAVCGVLALLFARNAASWKPATESAMPRIKSALKLKVTWQMMVLYAVTFGGFVAFSTYLPTLLKSEYGFSITDAGARTAGFALAAVIGRPVGGWLSDKFHPRTVLMTSLAITGVLAIAAAFSPKPDIGTAVVYVPLAFGLGLGTGAVFAFITKLVEPSRVGTVTGLVGAAGGLGGYFPPLVMGLIYGLTGSYDIGLMLLSDVAFAALVFTWLAFRGPKDAPLPRSLPANP